MKLSRSKYTCGILFSIFIRYKLYFIHLFLTGHPILDDSQDLFLKSLSSNKYPYLRKALNEADRILSWGADLVNFGRKSQAQQLKLKQS